MNLVISVEEYPKYQMFQLTKPQTSENRLRLDAGLKNTIIGPNEPPQQLICPSNEQGYLSYQTTYLHS
jgi:hypothetical protein